MPRYIVEYIETRTEIYEIEAADEIDAEELAFDGELISTHSDSGGIFNVKLKP